MSSNIQKAFEKKSALRRICMADGGLVDKAKTDLGNRTAVIDAAVDGKPSPVAAKPAPAPAPAPAPQSEDAARAAVGMAPKKGMLRTLLGMAEGGHVRGPGGPREDKVPAMLSDGEYVLPAKTVQKLGGPEELDELVQQTNDGKAPKGAEERGERHSGLRKLAGGGVIEIGADGLPRTNGVSIPVGQNLATIPGQTATPIPQTGTSLVPTAQPTPPPVQPAPSRGPAGAMDYERVGRAAAPVEAAAAEAKPLGRIASGLRTVKNAATGIAARGLPIAAGFVEGAGLDREPSSAAPTPGSGFTGANSDVPPEGKPWSPVAPTGPTGAPKTGFELAAQNSIDAITNPAQSFGAGLRQNMDALPGAAGALSTVGRIAQGGGKLAQFAGNLVSELPVLTRTGIGAGQAAVAGGLITPPAAPAQQRQAPGQEFGPPIALAGFGGTPTDAPASPRSLAQARYLAEHGVDAATQASAPVQGDLRGLKTDPGKFLNLGSFQGPDNIYGTSSKPGGRVNSFVGAGDPNRQETPQTIEAVKKLNSDLAADKLATAQKEEAQRQAQASQGNSGAINARFDAMANKVSGSYSAMGKGNENKRLLEIETQRNNALEADARNNISLRGQNQQMQIALANNQVQARGQDLSLEGHKQTLNQGREFHNDTLRQNAAQFAATQKQQDAAREEQNVRDRTAAVNELISRRFPDAKKAGSPDGEKAIDYTNFIAKQDPKLVAAYTKGNATEREEALATIDRLYETREKVNARGSSSLRGNTSLDTVLPVGNARNVEFGDYWGQGSLPWSNLPRRAAAVFDADAGKVQQMSNGQVVPLNDLTNDDSSVISNGKNASKVSALHQQRSMYRELEERARLERMKQETAKK